MHTYKTLTLDEAHAILDAAQKKAEEIGVPEVLCVADNAGYPIALRRLDGGKVTSVQIAMNKAFTAAGHRKRTDNYKNAYPGEEAFGIFTQHEGPSPSSSAACRSSSTASVSARSRPRAATASRTSPAARPGLPR